MKNCPVCNVNVEDHQNFCPNCGHRFAQPQQVYDYTSEVEAKAVKKEEKKSNGFAIAGFVCSFFSPILGWVFGGIGLSNANKMDGTGKGLSIAAIVIASISFVVSFILLMTYNQ
ncbi:MAG: hypothetical protein ACOX28_02150 [Bacilli bacterium]|jgi:uncharacterized membrane protein YvbJ